MIRAPTGRSFPYPRSRRKNTAAFLAARPPFALLGQPHRAAGKELFMAFFNSAVGVLQTLVIALGAGLGIWGVINLLEGYGNDNPGANAHVR